MPDQPRAQRLALSGPSAMRRSVDDLSIDQPTVPTAPEVVDSARHALERGETHYVDVPGIAPLRDKLAAFLHDLGLTDYDARDVLVTAGMQESRFLSIQTLGAHFGRLGFPAVAHPGGRQAIAARELALQPLPTDASGSMLPTLGGLERAFQDGCRLLYLESPSRLTGAAYDARQITRIAELARAFDAAIIWDQGLLPWVDAATYPSIATSPGMADRVVVIGEAWPGSGLESWFVGYLATNAAWFEELRSLKQIMSICTSVPAQHAAVRAADLYARDHHRQVETLTRVRSAALTVARTVGGQPLPGVAANLIACRFAREDAFRPGATRSIGVADGGEFGAPGLIRLAVTADGIALDAVAQAAHRSGGDATA